MMKVGIMRVLVRQRLMSVAMRMRLTGRIVRTVLVPVMLIVPMAVLVLHGFMRVFVLMPFSKV